MTTQDRKYEIVLYPDSIDYNCSDVIVAACNYFDYWAYILHDNDYNDDGTPKKPHYHFYGKSEKKLTIKGVAYQLGLKENCIQHCKTWKGAMRYLTHIDYPDKTSYQLDQIQCNFAIDQYYKSEYDDANMACMIFEYIASQETVTLESVARWVFENQCWSAYRRGYAVFHQIIAERNGKNDRSGNYAR